MSTDIANPTSNEDGEPLTLGVGMSFRTRPQSVLRKQRTSARLVGAVGRSSIGFGLAVGRSRSVHPVVRRVDLNSAALKPPTDFWRQRVDGADVEPVPLRQAAPASTSRGGDVVRRVSATPFRSSGRSPSAPRPQAPSPRASWTDQIIQRSSVGWTEQAALGVNQPPPAAPPDDFVSSGDSRLDAMRLALRAAASTPDVVESAATPSAPPIRRAPSGSRDRSVFDSPHVRPSASPAAGATPDLPPTHDAAATVLDTAPGTTSAGRRTGPGSLANSWRPDVVDETPAARVAREARTTVPSSATRAPAPRRGRDRLDDLRAALAARAAEESTGSNPGPPDADDANTGSRPPGRSADVRDDVPGGRARAGNQRDRPRPPAPSTSTTAQRRAAVDETLRRIRDTSRAGHAANRSTPRRGETEAADTTVRSPSDTGPTVTPDGTRPGPDATRAASDTARTTPDTPAPHEPRRAIDEFTSPPVQPDARSTAPMVERAQARESDPNDGGSAHAPPRSPIPSAALLRARRTLTSDGRSVGTTTTTEPRRTDPFPGTVPRPAGATVPPSATADGVMGDRPGSVATISAPTRSPSVAVPTLPVSPAAVQASGGTAPTQLLRRVTLPRAMSIGHRPPGSLRVEPRPPGSLRVEPRPPTGRSIERDTAVAPTPVPSLGVSDQTAPGSRAAHLSTPGDVTGTDAAGWARPSGPGSLEPVTTPPRPGPVPTAIRHKSSVHTSDTIRRSKSPDAPSWRADPRPNLLATALRGGSGQATQIAPAQRVISGGTTTADPQLARDAPTPSSTGARRTTPSPTARYAPPTTAGAAVHPAGPTAPPRPDGPIATGGSAIATGGSAIATGRSTAATDRPTDDLAMRATGSRNGPPVHVAAGIPVPNASTSADDTVRRSPDEPSPTAPGSARPTTSGELVTRFMHELSTTIQRRPDRLPSTYRPMADAITGGRRVMFSTDSASRKALRSVGKVAATTNDVIHLDTAITPRHRLDEVIAHELTHVAHPSATPRFFDDIDHSPEERKAEQMAELIARSPLAPNSPAASRPPKPSTDDTIRRTPATRSGSANDGSIGAASLASRISGTTPRSSSGSSVSSTSKSSPPHSSELLRRAIDKGTTSTGSSSSPSNSGEQIQRRVSSSRMGQFTESDTGSSHGGAPVGNLSDVPGAEDWFVEQLTRHFDEIINQLEQRMIVEFERRGGRTWGGI